MNLAQLQQAMSRDLAHGADRDFVALTGGHPGLAVYRNNYRGQLRDCLRDTFAQTWSWLGDDGFDQVADAYIDAHPPTGWTLDAFGNRFAAMLSTLHRDDPEIGELAWLEWTLRRAFDGPDGAQVDPAGLAHIDWEAARFAFVPTLTFGTMTTNAPAIWTALSDETPPPAAQMLPAPATIIVWRNDLAPSFRTIEPAEHRVLQLARDGHPFGAICATLAHEIGDESAAAAAGAALGQWLGEGLIAAID